MSRYWCSSRLITTPRLFHRRSTILRTCSLSDQNIFISFAAPMRKKGIERLQRPKQKSVYVGTDCGNVFGSTTKALVGATVFSKYNRLKTVYCPCHVMIFSSSMFRRRKASANESESHLLKNKRGQKKEKLII